MNKLRTRTNQPIIGDTIEGNLKVDGTISGSEIVQPLDNGISIDKTYWEKVKALNNSLEISTNFVKIVNINNTIHISFGLNVQGIANYSTSIGEWVYNFGRITLPQEIGDKLYTTNYKIILATETLLGSYIDRYIGYNILCYYELEKIDNKYYLHLQLRSGTTFNITTSLDANYRGELTLLLSDNLIK